jgi:quinol monooxygenase YgiN
MTHGPVSTLWATISVDPADSPTFLDALRGLHNEAAHDPDLLFFDLSESYDTPGTFHLVEIWAKDRDYLLNVRTHFHLPGSLIMR